MTPQLKDKLRSLPKKPGVYFHKNAQGEIIYVGKAAILRNRVNQYFHKSRAKNPKTDALVKEIVDVDWTVVADEVEALFLEAEMVRRYQPHYNILLRDDKSVCYVRINSKDIFPTVTITRRPIDDGADYYGPYMQSLPVKRSLQYLRKTFPYSTHTTLPKRACLQYHIGLCPGPETSSYNENEYRNNLKKLALYLKGRRVEVLKQLTNEMHQAASQKQFELAAKRRNALQALHSLRARIIFSDRENLDLSKDHALHDLSQLLNLTHAPRRIEGFDISHMSGTDTVASMVVFTNGVANKEAYRKFKMNIPGNDDFAHMNEVLRRRIARRTQRQWILPDLMLIDGGKGQLGAAIAALEESDINVPVIGLAKKFEEIVIHKTKSNVLLSEQTLSDFSGHISNESDDFLTISLPTTAHLIKLLQRIRDESHRFAVSYHSHLKTTRQTKSILEDIPGVGIETKKKLLRTFGSLKGVRGATFEELAQLVGVKKAKIIQAYIANE